jgi:signal transduction histidine kinase
MSPPWADRGESPARVPSSPSQLWCGVSRENERRAARDDYYSGDAGVLARLAVARRASARWAAGCERGPGSRAQRPLLVGDALALPLTAASLGRQALTGQDPSTAATSVGRALTGLIPLGFLAGIAWSRLRRTQATDLVVELRSTGGLTLRDRLARALGDSTLTLAYRLDDGRCVNESGELALVPDRPGRGVTLLTANDEVLAAVVHDPVLLDRPPLVDSVRATAGLVLENERLAAEVRAQLAQVRASRARLVAATDEERRRIERDLHDGAQQRLVALCVSLGLAAAGRAEGPARQTLQGAQNELEQAIAELRQLARGIDPTLLREEGLDDAVEGLARRAPLPVRVDGSIGLRLPPAVELAAYFVVCEALTNVVRHAPRHGRDRTADVHRRAADAVGDRRRSRGSATDNRRRSRWAPRPRGGP